jgi:N-acetylglucosamine PTS system EIICBA or EIICB component
VFKVEFNGVQKLGRALMLPIAVLPIAGLLLRLGQPDLLDIAFLAAAGDAVFSNLGVLFAVGVAVGFAKENHGAAGLAGALGFFITIKAAETLITPPPFVTAGLVDAAKDAALAAYKSRLAGKLSVPVGILAGILAGAMYNRFKDVKLPEYLAFFGGRRFVPIITGLASLGLALVFGLTWPHLEAGLDAGSRSVFASGAAGLFIYGVLNRLLLVTGLHHIVNNIAWFILGEYNGATGDLKRFFAGDPSAGAFMTGFFPVMMFGLPAACLAMYHAAPSHRRTKAGGLLFSMALTSLLTGVTEPIEFAFMFLAPSLYAIHAGLTGVALVVMNALEVKLGFSFSAGLFDYILNYGKATRPLLLLPVGAVYFAAYYGLFRLFITKFDLKTIGRDEEASASEATFGAGAPVPVALRGHAYLKALGGTANVLSIDACTTRLRVAIADGGHVDEQALKALGIRGIVRPAAGSVQVIIGPEADQIASEVQQAIRGAAGGASDITAAG